MGPLTIEGETRETMNNNAYRHQPKFREIGKLFLAAAAVGNRKELLSFLSAPTAAEDCPDDKDVCITAGDRVHPCRENVIVKRQIRVSYSSCYMHYKHQHLKWLLQEQPMWRTKHQNHPKSGFSPFTHTYFY